MSLHNATDQRTDQKGLGKPHKPQGREKRKPQERKGREAAVTEPPQALQCSIAQHGHCSETTAFAGVHRQACAWPQHCLGATNLSSRTRLLNAARKSSKDWCLRSISSQPPAAGMPRTPAAPSPANLLSAAAELPSCCSGLCETQGPGSFCHPLAGRSRRFSQLFLLLLPFPHPCAH